MSHPLKLQGLRKSAAKRPRHRSQKKLTINPQPFYVAQGFQLVEQDRPEYVYAVGNLDGNPCGSSQHV